MILSLRSVITLAFIFLFSIAIIAQEKPEEFRKAIEMADGYFTKGDYINAKASYQMALKLSPDDAYTKDRLQQSLGLIKVQMQQNALYNEKIVVADDLFRQGDLAGALTVYKSALEFLPGDVYANDRVKEIEKTFADERQKEADYKSGIAAGDKLLAAGNFLGSLEEYRKASGLKPEESYPKQKIAEVEKLIADQKMVAGSYEKAMADADLAIQRKKYDDAILLLESASKIKPDESLPKQKLAEVKEMKEDYSSYSSIIEQADNYYIEKEFEKARAGYQKALEIKPDDEYPKSMLDKIDIALMDIAKANKSSYELAIAQADKLYSQADYEQAMVEYKNALRFKPDETYAKQRISDINGTLSMMKSQEEAYAQSISRADNLYEEQRFEEAMEEYNRAIGFRPMEQYPKVKIDEIKVILSEIQNQRQIYSNLIAGADKLYYADDYEQARDQYRKASDLFPKEQYPLDQIRMINEILGQRDTYTKALTEADKLLYDKKYEDALAEYKRAAAINENEAYPQGRIYEIETLIAEEERMRGLQREYDSVLYLADDQFAAGDYITAMETYKAAQAILPTEGYPKKKMDEIRRIETETAAREAFDKQYSGYLSEADKLLAAGDLSKALTLYEAALNMKPGEDYPKARVAEIQGVQADIAAQEALEKQYAEVILNADKLFAAAEYQEALAAYQTAAGLKPSEVYPGEKIKEINSALGEIAVKEALDKQYADAISKADGLLASSDYQNALAAFQAASRLKPGEAYPGEKIKEINVRLEEIAAREALDKQYADAIAKADNMLAAKDYQAAIAAYNAAAKLMPEDNYPAGRIAEINSILEQVAAQEALDKKYADAIASADKLLAVKDYPDAIIAYEAALAIKPGEAYPSGKIAEINGLLGEIAAKEALDKQYAGTMASADLALQAGDYEKALAAYQAAVALKPAEKYPADKIKEINGILNAIAAKIAEDEKNYNDAIAFGDKHLANKDYENARKEYLLASSIKVGEAYPARKLSEIDAIEAEIRREKELETQYNKAIAAADAFMTKEQYEEARASYKDALTVKPDQDYPQQQLIEINRKLEMQAQERELSYQAAVAKADNYLEQQDYEMAKIQYERAIELKPDQVYPLDKLKLVNEQIMKKRQIVQAEYDKAIADADKYYASKLYDNAIESYRASSLLKPDEEYPKEMVRRILKMLSERSIVQINKDPLLITNNTQHKFDFLPVPVKDRKSNYIFFRARNVSPNDYKLIVNFGKDQAKNGGFVVKVPAGTDLNEYIIRISAQYKWFSDDNNWITFYPEGGDIEVSLLQISYSD